MITLESRVFRKIPFFSVAKPGIGWLEKLAGEEASQQLGLRGCDVAIIMAESESVLVLFLMESKQMIRSKVFFAVGMVCLHSIVLDCSSTQNSSGHSGFCGSSDQCEI